MKTSIRIIILAIIICIIGYPSDAQNFIGQHKDEIRKNASKYYPGFYFEKEVENGNKSFIKYVNTFEEQTLLFILNEQGVCTSTSRMYNTWLFTKVKSELNKKFEKKDSLIWLDYSDNKVYEIKLIKGEWFITVTTHPYKK